jgi:hypothetical protein
LRGVAGETATHLVISSPPAFAEFLLEASVAAPARTLPTSPPSVDPAALAELATAHGIEILGPPGALPAAA